MMGFLSCLHFRCSYPIMGYRKNKTIVIDGNDRINRWIGDKDGYQTLANIPGGSEDAGLW